MRPIRRALPILFAALLANAAPPEPDATGGWAAMAVADVAYIRDTNRKANIYAILGDAEFGRAFELATAEAVRDAPKVKSLQEYQALLKRYMGALLDPHARVRFNSAPSSYNWPGFLVRMRGDRYFVVASQTPGVADGAEVTGCDDKPVDAILDTMAPLESTVPGLQSTRAAMARLMMVDAGNPYYPRPTSCTIGGAAVKLAWVPITADALAVENARNAPFRDPSIWSKPFGANGAWVHMGVFFADARQAEQYHALYAQAPSLRTKDVIVIDVRGNGGGSYNWFMGFLRALYGDEYARYYAKARLKIQSVFITNPSEERRPSSQPASPRIPEPVDADLDLAETKFISETLPNGNVVSVLPEVRGAADPTTPPPPNPVKARVLLLTDNGCGSACISFSDEMRRFPGVQQIGADTFVDRLSGTPVTTNLPSGNGTLGIPSMTRRNRVRGDNEPRKPVIRYDGDMADTAALERWITDTVLKTPVPKDAIDGPRR